MPCPFPGMDPYLEMQPFWSDFAPDFLASMRNALLGELLPRYDVRIEEYMFVMHEDIRLHRVKPDVSISSTLEWEAEATSATALAGSNTIELEYPDIEPQTQRHLKIIHGPNEELVTVIELLSPTNKRSGEDGIDAYLEKRTELVASGINLVEIDLLRGGDRLPMRGSLPQGDYYVYVGRTQRKPRCEVMGWPLKMPLPTIPIPLLPGEQETNLDLAAVFRGTYDAAFYDRRLPYQQPLEPKPTEEEAAWIKGLLPRVVS